MERFINILILDHDPDTCKQLKRILYGGGSNLIFCCDVESAWKELKKRRIGIILINIQNRKIDSLELLKQLGEDENSRDAYKIIIGNKESKVYGARMVKGIKNGAVDYITIPFNSQLVKAKINVFKALYFKDERISQLLESIFPRNVLNDLNSFGKYSPRKIDEAVVMFTDFVAFTRMTQVLGPLELIRKLEDFFKKFDEIIDRYQLEKIKTIGDAYMAIGGVTESNGNPALRATLAAIEIRDYIDSQNELSKYVGEEPWSIRIGLHAGPLFAGIISSKKMSFDVWGNTVNIAARAEQNSEPNSITITNSIAEKVEHYLDISHRGEVEVKHGGFVDMYFVDNIKTQYSLFREGKLPNSFVRRTCDLPEMDFDYMRTFTYNKLKSQLPQEMDYHSIKHTYNVEKAAIRIARLEGLCEEDLTLLRTAVILHDAGFIHRYENNENLAIEMAENELPLFGYKEEQIKVICQIINATKRDVKPKTLLEMIMRDSDNDYLGRADYYAVAKTLRREYENLGKFMSELEWVDFQLNYLVNIHRYYTETAKNIRLNSKKKRILELKELRKELIEL